ncbi:MAG: hypothetical protein H8D82_02125, partial [Euryarchaeota archaeon]|nr:hypothetical protein [Euryarchaeota archaeon]
QVARRMYNRTGDLVKSIEVGLRVGLAILTEAVLVAPLEGISNVRLLNNADGSQFVSVDFCGPIRAAGGTAQALAVLITDVVRRELEVGPYIARREEIERVKEEFGLYRGNLQYRPPPEEIEAIVKACPIMVNGESTESQECAGYGNIENVDGSRVRGGVLLVIGEGLCLKAPKVQKHTERLQVEGWEFISHFANKGKSSGTSEKKTYQKRAIKPISRFMEDIIAGRPVFGEPLAAGGFRLRYGRTRATGLAAGSLSPVTMHAMGDFIAVGTQLKIERPGKATAITPSDKLQGPIVLLNNGAFGRVDNLESWKNLEKKVNVVWDNGEMMLGYGEFLENNKNLIPSSYNRDWWAADLLETLVSRESVEKFASIIGVDTELPAGIPGAIPNDNDALFQHKRNWVRFLRDVDISWDMAVSISNEFGTAVPPPWNINWLDLPIEWVLPLHDAVMQSELIPSQVNFDDAWNNDSKSDNWMRIKGAASNWSPQVSLTEKPDTPPGLPITIIPPINSRYRAGDSHEWHGVIKSSIMLLGLPHYHDGDDLIITSSWEGMLDGLGLTIRQGGVEKRIDINSHLSDRIERLKLAVSNLKEENERMQVLESERALVRVEAETAARQRGEGIAGSDRAGDAAAAKVEDTGPKDADKLYAAEKLLDDQVVDGILPLVRECGTVRWEHNTPVRIGARMARPEKAAHRLMKTAVNALFPIGTQGGPQKLLSVASGRGNLRVSLGVRECLRCGRPSPFTQCHHRMDKEDPKSACLGKTNSIKSEKKKFRRQGEFQTIPLRKILESKIEELGIELLPKIKCIDVLPSKAQTPEPLEKGILRARHKLPVFRDGTVRFDMSDIPETHFRPCEIGTPHNKLVELGYKVDIDGEPLVSDEQILELYPQDFIPSTKAIGHLVATCQFIDELLIRYYKMEPHYNVTDVSGLVGQMTIALAPHTSGGVLSRIIGFTDASGGYAHTLFHAAK